MVSVLIVTYNSSPTIENCLASLNNQTCKDFEVILVDNCSSDDTVGIIESLRSRLGYPLRLIPLRENKGFAGGNNHALKFAGGQYIALLNPDAFADAAWLDELLKEMGSHPEAGIGASKMIVYGSQTIDSAGDGFSTALKGYKRGEGKSAQLFGQEEYVFGACAGAALYRKKMIDEIGFFDEEFFLIHEDTDLNFRVQLAGWRVLYVPTAVVQHKVGASIGNMSDTAFYYALRNSELVKVKNVPFWICLKCLPAFVIGEGAEVFYFAVRHRRLKLYLKAKLDALRLLPSMLEKRRAIMNDRKVDNGYIASRMTSVLQVDYLRDKVKKLFYG
jgi:GT2 family glycosyltransferase